MVFSKKLSKPQLEKLREYLIRFRSVEYPPSENPEREKVRIATCDVHAAINVILKEMMMRGD